MGVVIKHVKGTASIDMQDTHTHIYIYIWSEKLIERINQ